MHAGTVSGRDVRRSIARLHGFLGAIDDDALRRAVVSELVSLKSALRVVLEACRSLEEQNHVLLHLASGDGAFRVDDGRHA